MILVGSRKTVLRFIIFSIVVTAAALYIAYKLPYVRERDFGDSWVDLEDSVYTMSEARLETNDFYVESRLEREKIRSREIELLEEIGGNPNIQSEIRNTAGKRILEIGELMTKENEAENLIRARGYRDALVYIQGGSALAMVKADRMELVDVTRIGDIVSRATGVKIYNITIVAKP